MTEKKAVLENVINNTINDMINNIDTKDDADDADDEMSIAESENIRSINVMIYDDVESEFESEIDIELGEHETNRLNNNNKLNIDNKINYFNDYILVPIHVIYDYCKIIYNYINIF